MNLFFDLSSLSRCRAVRDRLRDAISRDRTADGR